MTMATIDSNSINTDSLSDSNTPDPNSSLTRKDSKYYNHNQLNL